MREERAELAAARSEVADLRARLQRAEAAREAAELGRTQEAAEAAAARAEVARLAPLLHNAHYGLAAVAGERRAACLRLDEARTARDSATAELSVVRTKLAAARSEGSATCAERDAARLQASGLEAQLRSALDQQDLLAVELAETRRMMVALTRMELTRRQGLTAAADAAGPVLSEAAAAVVAPALVAEPELDGGVQSELPRLEVAVAPVRVSELAADSSNAVNIGEGSQDGVSAEVFSDIFRLDLLVVLSFAGSVFAITHSLVVIRTWLCSLASILA